MLCPSSNRDEYVVVPATGDILPALRDGDIGVRKPRAHRQHADRNLLFVASPTIAITGQLGCQPAVTPLRNDLSGASVKKVDQRKIGVEFLHRIMVHLSWLTFFLWVSLPAGRLVRGLKGPRDAWAIRCFCQISQPFNLCNGQHVCGAAPAPIALSAPGHIHTRLGSEVEHIL